METTLTLTEAELGEVYVALFDARGKGTAEQRINTRLALRKVYEAQNELAERAARARAAEWADE